MLFDTSTCYRYASYLITLTNLGVQPRYMGIGPVFAIPKVLKQVGLKKEDVDVWEVRESFLGGKPL